MKFFKKIIKSIIKIDKIIIFISLCKIKIKINNNIVLNIEFVIHIINTMIK